MPTFVYKLARCDNWTLRHFVTVGKTDAGVIYNVYNGCISSQCFKVRVWVLYSHWPWLLGHLNWKTAINGRFTGCEEQKCDRNTALCLSSPLFSWRAWTVGQVGQAIGGNAGMQTGDWNSRSIYLSLYNVEFGEGGETVGPLCQEILFFLVKDATD